MFSCRGYARTSEARVFRRRYVCLAGACHGGWPHCDATHGRVKSEAIVLEGGEGDREGFLVSS